MIDFRFVLLIIFTLMLIFVALFREKNEIVEGMMYISGFGFFFVGLDILINGISNTSTFLKITTSIVFWGIGIITLIRTPLVQIEEQEW